MNGARYSGGVASLAPPANGFDPSPGSRPRLAAPHAWYNLPMHKHENRLSASVIAGAACTIIAVVGGLFLVTVHLGWVPDDLVEPTESVIVGVIGVSIAAFALWLVIRYVNRCDDPGR